MNRWIENSDKTDANYLTNSEDEDFLLPDCIYLSNEMVIESDISLLTKLDDNDIEQLVPTEKYPIPSLPIPRQSIKKEKEKQTTNL